MRVSDLGAMYLGKTGGGFDDSISYSTYPNTSLCKDVEVGRHIAMSLLTYEWNILTPHLLQTKAKI